MLSRGTDGHYPHHLPDGDRVHEYTWTWTHRDLEVTVGGELRESRNLGQDSDGEGLSVALWDRVCGHLRRCCIQASVLLCQLFTVSLLPHAPRDEQHHREDKT